MASLFTLSVLAAAAPVFLTARAVAAPGVSYTSTISLTDGWVTDRTAPSGGSDIGTYHGRQARRIGVTPPSSATSSFYQYEGLKKDISAEAVSGDLWLDSSWPSNTRVEFWARGQASDGSISSYPVFEYTTDTTLSATGWRVFDSDYGNWRPVTVTSAIADNWNTIELVINKQDPSKTDVYVNNVLAAQSISDVQTVKFDTLYFNNYNYTTGTNSYDIYWSNLKGGSLLPEAPTNLSARFVNPYVSVPSGSTVSGTKVATTALELIWNAPTPTDSSVTGYRIYGIFPDGSTGSSVQGPNTNGWLRSVGTYDYYANGFGQHGDGAYKYTVKALRGNLESTAATNEVVINYDNTAPTVTGISQKYDGIDSSGNTRIWVTLTFSEPVNSPGQGWNEVSGSGKTKYTKVYYSSKPYTISFTDLAGNPGSYAFTVDASKPSISITAPTPAGSVVNNSDSVAVAASDNQGLSKISFQLYSGTTALSDNSNALPGKTATLNTTALSDSLSRTIGSFGLANGTYNIKATATDQTGNYVVLQNYSFTVDNTAPVITVKNATSNSPSVAAIPSGSFVSTTINNQLRLFVDDTNLDQILLDGVAKAAWTGLDKVGIAYLTSGTHTFQAIDKAGNPSAVITLTFDNVAPSIPQITSPLVGAYFNGTSTTNEWTDPTDATSGVKGYQVKYVLTTGTQYRSETSDHRTQTFSGTYQGPITISVRAQDNANNWSDWGTPVTYYYDSVAPDAPTPSITSGSAVVSGASVSLTTVDPSATIYYTLDGTTPTLSSTLYTGPIALTGLPVTLKAIAYDLAGNPSSVTTASYVAGGSGGDSSNLQGVNDGTNNIQGTDSGNNQAVLGASTTTPNATTTENTSEPASDDTDVLGTSTDNNSKGSLAWYWWVLIALAAIGLGWLVAWLRSRNSEEN